MIYVTLPDDQIVFHTVDGLTETGPGDIWKMSNLYRAPFKLYLYKADPKNENNQLHILLGTYAAEADADRELELIQLAVDSNVTDYYMAGDPEHDADKIGIDGKKYPSNNRQNREKIIMAIVNNPTASDAAIAKMTGTSHHTVKKCREIFNQNKSGKD